MSNHSNQYRVTWIGGLGVGCLLATAGLAAAIAIHAAVTMANAILVAVAAVAGTICLIGSAFTGSRMLLIAIGINVVCWLGFGQSVLVAKALDGSESSADPIEKLFMLATSSGVILYLSTSLLLCGAAYSFMLFWDKARSK